MAVLERELPGRVWAVDAANAAACMSCGVCSAVCPVGIDILPRRLIRYALLGMEEKVLEEHEAVFSCLLCKLCEVNCPAGVHIAEHIRSLRHYINQQSFSV